MSIFEGEIPYNDLQMLTPNVDIKTKSIPCKAISVGRALAHNNGTQMNFQNPSLLLNTVLFVKLKHIR